MKIGIITNLYPPHERGGAEKVIVRTVGQLMAMGHEVFVISGQPKAFGKAVTTDNSSTERIYRFFPKNLYFTLDDYRQPWLKRLVWHVRDAFSWHGAEHVRTILRDETPDVVITHNLKGIGLNIPSVIKDLGLPHIHIMHDLQLIVPSGLLMFGAEKEPWYLRPAYGAYRALCRAKFGNPDTVVYPSEYLLSMYQRYGFFPRSKVVMMANPAPKYQTLRAPGRIAGPLKMLFIGQLGKHKGVEFLLNLSKKHTGEARLYIAGTGPMRAEVERAAQNDKRIVYLGFTLPEELINVFSVVDALIVPSLCYENSPTVIYEALMAGVPVVASRIGGVGELIEEGKTGFLFTPGDEEAFIAALRKMNDMKEELAKNREAIRKTMDSYALDIYCARLVALCEEAREAHQRV